MRRFLAGCLLAGAAAFAAPPAWAEEVALIVANTQYQNYPDRAVRDDVLGLEPRLRQAGFRTIVVRNLDSGTLAQQMADIAQQLNQADKAIVVLSGYYAFMGHDSWLVTTDANRPNSFTIGRFGLSLGALYNIAAGKQGDMVIAVAAPGNDPNIGWRLGDGFRVGEIPQGVTVITGNASQVTDFVGGPLLVPGLPLAEAAGSSSGGVSVLGYLPASRSFLTAAAPPIIESGAAEYSLWQQSADLNTVAAYERYLRRYPNGRYAAQARARIQDLSLSPADQARLIEEGLNLSRDQRRRLQEYLTVLGFDTHGIDGLFGPNTRSAVQQWQASIGATGTGYLNANQVARIERDGAIRAEQLRREAERRRLEQELRDRQYWDATGSGGSEEGLRTYLNRYPDGLYSDVAKAGLKEIEREKRRQAEEAERLAWDDAVIQGTVQSYQQYLQRYPNGRFADAARARIQALSEPETPPAVVEAAKNQENQMNLDPFRKRLIEAQLAQLNFDPGPVDGQFTEETRRALRKYQRANDMPVTGYVSRDTVVRLLVSAIDR